MHGLFVVVLAILQDFRSLGEYSFWFSFRVENPRFVVGSEDVNIYGVRGHAPPTKFDKTLITLECISRIFIVEKEEVNHHRLILRIISSS